mgnify:CR=1 FL=1|tara:strand:+ start:495 stop:1100 length:606 start_codon:yes stop_codon:yes gene_type:complete
MNNRFTLEEMVTLLDSTVDAYCALYGIKGVNRSELEIERLVKNNDVCGPDVTFYPDHTFSIKAMNKTVFSEGGFGIDKSVELCVLGGKYKDRDVDGAANILFSSMEKLINVRELKVTEGTNSVLEPKERLLPFLKIAFSQGWKVRIWISESLTLGVSAVLPEGAEEVDISHLDVLVTDLAILNGKKVYSLGWGIERNYGLN